MLSAAQKTLLLAFGRIIANLDCYVECASCSYKGTDHVRVRVSDRDASYVDLEGHGVDVTAAFDNVVKAFEAHPMGTSRSSVEAWIAAGCPDDFEPQPDTIREPMIEAHAEGIMIDASPDALMASDLPVILPDSYDVDLTDVVSSVRPAVKRVLGGTRAKDMTPGPHRRWLKASNQRHERRKVRSMLRNGSDV